MTFVILTAGIDLSVGSLVALTGLAGAYVAKGGLESRFAVGAGADAGNPVILAFLAAVAVGLAGGGCKAWRSPGWGRRPSWLRWAGSRRSAGRRCCSRGAARSAASAPNTTGGDNQMQMRAGPLGAERDPECPLRLRLDREAGNSRACPQALAPARGCQAQSSAESLASASPSMSRASRSPRRPGTRRRARKAHGQPILDPDPMQVCITAHRVGGCDARAKTRLPGERRPRRLVLQNPSRELT